VLALVLAPRAQANVYATNIRFNGGLTNVTLTTNVTISYTLNEPASAGLVLEIKSGLNTLRTFTFTNDQPGALRGTNVVVWNGRDNASNVVPVGPYSVRITARSAGYNEWKQITDDNNVGNAVWEGRGIAVDQNPASPYYGRVFVANAYQGPNTNANISDRIGILKLNADGSPAAEGSFSTGGWTWSGEYVSPWKIEVGQDDRVYVNDWIGSGVVLSFDPTISAASRRVVLRDDNWPNAGAVNFGGLFINGQDSTAQVWMTDITTPGVGIRVWPMTNGIVATDDLGVTAVASGSGSDLNISPWDVALDANNRIYTIQYETELTGTPADHLLAFPPYQTGTTQAQTLASWKVGGTADTLGAHGVAVDPTGTYVAVAFQRLLLGAGFQDGSVKVYYLTNGALAGVPTMHAFTQDYRDVAWDRVGNLYVLDNFNTTWRAYSPPSGSNQAVTVSAINITVGPAGPIRPLLSEPSYTNGQFHCFLTGEPNVLYFIEATTNFTTWSVVATNSSALAKRPITVAAPNSLSFYRAVAGAAQRARPVLSAPMYAAGQFQCTLQGEAGVSYVIQSSADLVSWTSVVTNASGGATRQITLPSSASRNSYRAWALP
jgi:hypothetical protein